MAKNVYDFAVEFEREHRDFYKEMIEKTEEKRLKQVFSMLVEQEEKHEKIVEQLRNKERVEHVESDILPDAKKTFEDIASDLPNSVLPDDQVELYKKAREMEERTYNFYKEKAEEAELEKIKEVFEKLAGEEKKHENILSNLIDFVNKPNTWLEDAEWYHLEDY
ncbi:MAG TPA: ferritin family protein [Halanaerobiales bacterium]|nr:ferritin family protein [Halanaerobiales bacterium]